jgi:glycosyltransferase involved in cell wall biosynthesis
VTGDRLKLYYLARELSQRHELALLCFIRSDKELDNVTSTSKYFTQIEVVRRLPSVWDRIYNLKMQRAINWVLEHFQPDIVQIETLVMAQYVYPTSNPKVFVPNDALSLLLHRQFLNSRTPFSKVANLAKWWAVATYEKVLYRRFDHCITLSPQDKAVLQQRAPAMKITVIPNGVDYDFFRPSSQTHTEPNLIFTGVMQYYPNVDAVLYFYKDIFHQIKRVVPNVRLYIVGKGPTRSVQALQQDPAVVVTGFVADLRPYLDRASVYVASLRIGSGVKNKILEAMAMGKAIVATPISVEGIDAVHGEHLIIAETPEMFALWTVQLLQDGNLRQQLGMNARRLIEERYSWARVAREYEGVYEQALQSSNRTEAG